MKRIISVVSLFFLLQLFFTIPAVLLSSFGNVMKGMTGRPNVPSTDIDPTIYACALIAFNICMIGILMKTRWVNSTIRSWKEIEAKHLLACIPAVLFGIFVVNGISELAELAKTDPIEAEHLKIRREKAAENARRARQRRKISSQ